MAAALPLGTLSLAAFGPSLGEAAPAAAVAGSPQAVFSWDRDHCPGRRGYFETRGGCANDVQTGCDPDVTDAPVKAFRRAAAAAGAVDGKETFVLGPVDLGSRPLVGASLGDAKHRCDVYANSTYDYRMSMAACREWIQSPYAFPNGSVYALTHMEYHNKTSGEGLWSAVTLLASHDTGASWSHAREPPNHIVAATPVAFAAGTPLFGFRSPSNIIRSHTAGDEKHYYAFVTAGWGDPEPVHGQPRGACLMRTADVTDPASWRAWNGRGFDVALAVNPYVAPVPDPAAHVCTPVTNMTYISLLWSTFFSQYVIVGTNGGNDRGGWTFQLSDDLVRWSAPVPIDPSGWITPAGNATRRPPPNPVPGTWIRREHNGTAIYWLNPSNETKHWNTNGCTPCGVPACDPSVLHVLPDATFDAIPEGRHFGCELIGAGGAGVADYIYPSLIDPTAPSDNYEEVGEAAMLFLVTDNCVSWTKPPTGPPRCSPWDGDAIVHRDIVAMPVRFSK